MTPRTTREAEDRADEASAGGALGGLSGSSVVVRQVQWLVLTVGREGDGRGEQAAENGRRENGVEGTH